MKTTLRIKIVLVSTLAGLPFAQLAAQDAPPEIPGNPGVPGLLAEISELEQELAATVFELETTERELTATQGELTLTQTSLATTQTELQLTQDNLDVTNALLDESLDALEREQNRYRVPQTGQNECWDAFSEDPDSPHNSAPCGFTGQDGEYEAGLAPPSNRFVDNGDGTVTDRFTELVWLKQADCLDDLEYSWSEATSFGKNLFGTANICGLQDGSAAGSWRLPNVRELMSLLDYGSPGYQNGGAALPDGHPFTAPGTWYWTSTTYAIPPSFPVAQIIHVCTTRQYGSDNRPRFNEAYVVNLSTGEVIHTPKEDRETISRRHDAYSPGVIGGDESCERLGFRNGSPPNGLPMPSVIVVRDIME